MRGSWGFSYYIALAMGPKREQPQISSHGGVYSRSQNKVPVYRPSVLVPCTVKTAIVSVVCSVYTQQINWTCVV